MAAFCCRRTSFIRMPNTTHKIVMAAIITRKLNRIQGDLRLGGVAIAAVPAELGDLFRSSKCRGIYQVFSQGPNSSKDKELSRCAKIASRAGRGPAVSYAEDFRVSMKPPLQNGYE